MTSETERSTRQLFNRAMVLFAAVALMLPATSTVLCVAPGGHTAIEDLNAACCASALPSAQEIHHPNNGWSTAKGCGDCTDYFISLNERGSIPEHFSVAASVSSGEEICKYLASPQPLLPRSSSSSTVLAFAALATPLRC